MAKVDRELDFTIGYDRVVNNLSYEELREKYNITDLVVNRAQTYYLGVIDGRGFSDVWNAEAPRTKKRQLERVLKRMETEFKLRVEAKVQIEYRKRMNQLGEGILQEKLDEVHRVLGARRGMISSEDYKLIKSILHPDSNASIEKKTKAFQIFCAMDILLMDNKEDNRTSGFPTTFEELRRRRNEKGR